MAVSQLPIGKFFFCPGIRLHEVTAVCEDVTSEDDRIILPTYTTHSEELLENFRCMINQYKSKTNGCDIISGILPKVGAVQTCYYMAFSTSTELQTLCSQSYTSSSKMTFFVIQVVWKETGYPVLALNLCLGLLYLFH